VNFALEAERLGFDFVSSSDHPAGSEPNFETWTLLAFVAAQTSRIHVATRVLGLPFNGFNFIVKEDREPAQDASVASRASCSSRLLPPSAIAEIRIGTKILPPPMRCDHDLYITLPDLIGTLVELRCCRSRFATFRRWFSAADAGRLADAAV
jgi:hypothetical protein